MCSVAVKFPGKNRFPSNNRLPAITGDRCSRPKPEYADPLDQIDLGGSKYAGDEDMQSHTHQQDLFASRFQSGKRLFKTAAIVSVAALIICIATGFLSYSWSRRAHLRSIAITNRVLADQVAYELDRSLTPKPNASDALDRWEQLPRSHPDMFLCVVDHHGKLIAHSKNPKRVGLDVSKVVLPSDPVSTVGDLLRSQSSWVGENRNAAGHRQLAAYAFSSKLDGLVVIHTPATVYDTEIRAATIPWIAGFIVATVVLWPACLLLAYFGFQRLQSTSDDAEQEIRNRLVELDHVYRTTPVGLCFVGTDLRYRRINDLLAEINGQPIEAHLGRHVNELIPDIADKVEAAYQQVITTGQPILDIEVTRQENDSDEHRVYRVSYHPVKNTDGSLHGVGTVVQDITDERRAEEARFRHQAELAHMARVNTMGELVAGIAHEINQPLAAISSFATACQHAVSGKSKSADVPVEEWLEQVSQNAVRCGEIIRGLRDFVSKGDVESKRLSLAKIVRDAISLTKYKQHSRLIEFSCDVAPGHDMVVGSEVQLHQVVVNLLVNACDAIEDAPKAKIHVHLTSDESQLTLTVEDNGPGIPEEQSARLFDPFFSTKPNGMGMGLAISRTIVEAHHGKLCFDSSYTEGARIRVMLPATANSDLAPTDSPQSGQY